MMTTQPTEKVPLHSIPIQATNIPISVPTPDARPPIPRTQPEDRQGVEARMFSRPEA
jgi:hypothetical protein